MVLIQVYHLLHVDMFLAAMPGESCAILWCTLLTVVWLDPHVVLSSPLEQNEKGTWDQKHWEDLMLKVCRKLPYQKYIFPITLGSHFIWASDLLHQSKMAALE